MKIKILIAFLLLPLCLSAKTLSEKNKMDTHPDKLTLQTPHGNFDHTHRLFSDILAQFVVVKGPLSQVKYGELKSNPQALNIYLSTLSHVKKSEFSKWNKNQQMAFLINAYNAFTLKLIIDHYPVKSIKDIGSFFKKPWSLEFFKLLGKKETLDNIEHKMLRPIYKEPRVHFAVNCASIGCPMLANRAFSASELEAQLNKQTKLFLRDKSRNRIDRKNKKVFVSKIFDWFEKDFQLDGSSVTKFIAPYITDDKKLQKELIQNKFEVDHLSYDWNLNGVK